MIIVKSYWTRTGGGRTKNQIIDVLLFGFILIYRHKDIYNG